MTVKELKEKLEQFDDNLLVMIPNRWYLETDCKTFEVPARNVSRGVNEFDGCLFIDEYEEDDE